MQLMKGIKALAIIRTPNTPSIVRLPAGPQCIRRPAVAARSFIPDSVEDFLEVSTLVASGIAIVGTAALALRAPPRRDRPEGFDYGLMGFVSFIPLFNWTAWVIPAIQQPERAPLYWSYALLYAWPLLSEGFDIEKYTLAMLALCVVHVQVERIAATEPELLREAKPMAALLSVLGTGAQKVFGSGSSLSGIVSSDAKQIVRGPAAPGLDDGSLPQGSALPERSPEEELELKEFDRRMLARDQRRRQQQQGLLQQQQGLLQQQQGQGRQQQQQGQGRQLWDKDPWK